MILIYLKIHTSTHGLIIEGMIDDRQNIGIIILAAYDLMEASASFISCSGFACFLCSKTARFP